MDNRVKNIHSKIKNNLQEKSMLQNKDKQVFEELYSIREKLVNNEIEFRLLMEELEKVEVENDSWQKILSEV